MVLEIDTNESGCITSQELHEYIGEGKLKGFLMTLGLHIKDPDLFFGILHSNSNEGKPDGGSVAVEDFIQECMRLKGFATNLDLQVLTTKVDTVVDRQRLWEYKQRQYHMESKELLDELVRSNHGIVVKQG